MKYKALAKTLFFFSLPPLWFLAIPYWQATSCFEDSIMYWKECVPGESFRETFGGTVLIHFGISIGLAVVAFFVCAIVMLFLTTYRHFSEQE